MESRTIGATALLLVGLGLCVSSAGAASVYGEPADAADMSGSRSVGSGLDTDVPSWSGNSIAWDVTFHGTHFTYRYIFAGFNGRRSTISHFSLDLTDDAVTDDDVLLPGTIWDLTITDLGALVNDPVDDVLFCASPLAEGVPVSNGNGDIGGSVKIQCPDGGPDWPLNSMVTFNSHRSPVYGHVILKTGVGELWNAAWADPGLEGPESFIVRPNGHVPEPLTMLGVFLGVAGLALPIRKRRVA